MVRTGTNTTTKGAHFILRPESAAALYFGEGMSKETERVACAALCLGGVVSLLLSAMLCVSARFMSKAKVKAAGTAHALGAAALAYLLFASTSLTPFPSAPYSFWLVWHAGSALFFLATTHIARKYDPAACPPGLLTPDPPKSD